MFVRLLGFLDDLIEGTRPLPSPFPQHLNFPRNFQVRHRLAHCLARHLILSGIVLDDDELRHLVFKVASYLCRTGHVGDSRMVVLELHRIWPALRFTLRANRSWLTSKGGVPWTLNAYEAWYAKFNKTVRSRYGEPPRVADLPCYPGFYLAELTNSSHVYAEGVALEHCMSWSVSDVAMKKHGYKDLSSPESLECLTYAIKLRTRELRIFSLRNEQGGSVATLAYHLKKRRIVESRFRAGICDDPHHWSVFRCALAKALHDVIDFEHEKMRGGCLRSCSLAGWCEQQIAFESEDPKCPTAGVSDGFDWS